MTRQTFTRCWHGSNSDSIYRARSRRSVRGLQCCPRWGSVALAVKADFVTAEVLETDVPGYARE